MSIQASANSVRSTRRSMRPSPWPIIPSTGSGPPVAPDKPPRMRLRERLPARRGGRRLHGRIDLRRDETQRRQDRLVAIAKSFEQLRLEREGQHGLMPLVVGHEISTFHWIGSDSTSPPAMTRQVSCPIEFFVSPAAMNCLK